VSIASHTASSVSHGRVSRSLPSPSSTSASSSSCSQGGACQAVDSDGGRRDARDDALARRHREGKLDDLRSAAADVLVASLSAKERRSDVNRLKVPRPGGRPGPAGAPHLQSERVQSGARSNIKDPASRALPAPRLLAPASRRRHTHRTQPRVSYVYACACTCKAVHETSRTTDMFTTLNTFPISDFFPLRSAPTPLTSAPHTRSPTSRVVTLRLRWADAHSARTVSTIDTPTHRTHAHVYEQARHGGSTTCTRCVRVPRRVSPPLCPCTMAMHTPKPTHIVLTATRAHTTSYSPPRAPVRYLPSSPALASTRSADPSTHDQAGACESGYTRWHTQPGRCVRASLPAHSLRAPALGILASTVGWRVHVCQLRRRRLRASGLGCA
jgi:hypothetical protein